ncbi:MAG: hypothetical protein HRF47_02770, partial [Chloroflexota bacterium]
MKQNLLFLLLTLTLLAACSSGQTSTPVAEIPPTGAPLHTDPTSDSPQPAS